MKKIYKRYIKNRVKADLKDKMVFVGGPRQVGKTTFALTYLPEPSEKHPAYLNWDNILIHSQLLKGELPPNEKIIVFDEIHKFARWRNLVKGFYDTRKSEISFIITGSARLDYYSKGGDSLQGRYHYYRLHPFSLRELNNDASESDVQNLLISLFLKTGDQYLRLSVKVAKKI
jgi:predicted AAA+ superfamily ATPase